MKFKSGDEFVKNLVNEYCPSPTISSTIRLDTYYKKAHSMFYEALDAVKQGKDARAYIALMRYAQFVSALTKHNNYNAEEYEKERNANKRRLNNAITKLEELKPKIIKMYDDKIQKEKEEQLQSKPQQNDTNPAKVIEPKQSTESIAVDPSIASPKAPETANEEIEATVSLDDMSEIEMPPAPPPNIRELNRKQAKYGKKRRKSKQFGFRKKDNFSIKIESEDGDEKELNHCETEKEKKKGGVLSVGWNSKEDKIKKKVNKIKRKQKRSTYDGWSISDICYINGKEYLIKRIHFDTKPPTLTVALRSDEERKFVTEFDLISKEPAANINNANSTQAQNALKMNPDDNSNKQTASHMDNKNNNDVIHQRPMYMNNNTANYIQPKQAPNALNTYNNAQAVNHINNQQIEKNVQRNNEHLPHMKHNNDQRPIYRNNKQGNNVNQRTNPINNNMHMNNMNKPQIPNAMRNYNKQSNVNRNNINYQNNNQRPMYRNDNYGNNVNRRINPSNNNTNVNKMNNHQPIHRNNSNVQSAPNNMMNKQPVYRKHNNNAQAQTYVNNQRAPKNMNNHNNIQQPLYRNHNVQNRNNRNNRMSNQRPMNRNHNMNNDQYNNTNRNHMHQHNQKGAYINNRNNKQLPPQPPNNQINHNKKPEKNHTQYVGFKPPPPNFRDGGKKPLPPNQPRKELPKKPVQRNNEANNVWNINENAEDDSDDEDYKKNKVLESYKRRRSSINYDDDECDQIRARRGSIFDESSSSDDDGGANGTGRRLSVDISNAPIASVSAHVNFN